MDSSTFLSLLKNNQHHFHPVIPFDPAKDKLLAMDFTGSNRELSPGILTDTRLFTQWVNERLSSAGARYGIGGYDELRVVYSASNVFDPEQQGEEPRRLHLGIDTWGKPYTPVMAPLDGIVHSAAFNNRFGDYGATLILSHSLEGASFHTLYGHLSLQSIKNFAAGDRVERGDVIAEFGIPADNGQWPPHLHFQLIREMGDWSGDYPGVCAESQKEKWLANCPDPDLILQLNKYLPV